MKKITINENLFNQHIVIEPKNKIMLILLLTIYASIFKKSITEIIDSVNSMLNSTSEEILNINCNTKEILIKTLEELKKEFFNGANL